MRHDALCALFRLTQGKITHFVRIYQIFFGKICMDCPIVPLVFDIVQQFCPTLGNYLVIVLFLVATLKIIRKLVQKIIKSCALHVVLHCS